MAIENPDNRILTFATDEQIAAYNEAIGAPSRLTELLGVPRFSAQDIIQANLRTNNHFRIQYFNDLKTEYTLNRDGSGTVATTLEELQPEVCAALQEGVSIGAGLELLTPNFFSATVNSATDVQVKKIGSIEFFEQKNASTTVNVDATRGQANDINRLLNRFVNTDLLPPPTNADGTPTTPITTAPMGNRFVGIYGNRRR